MPKLKRCENKTRRNKKTGVCEPPKSKSISRKNISQPKMDKIIAELDKGINEFISLYTNIGTAKRSHGLIMEIKSKLITLLTPVVNQKLPIIEITEEDMDDIIEKFNDANLGNVTPRHTYLFTKMVESIISYIIITYPGVSFTRVSKNKVDIVINGQTVTYDKMETYTIKDIAKIAT